MDSKNLIEMRSLTQAQRAKDVLQRNGIRSKIVRTPGGAANGGCSFSLYIPSQFDKARNLIRSLDGRRGGTP